MHIAVCSRCGRRRHQAGALIPFKGALICDSCIIENNKKVLKEFEDSDINEMAPEDADRETAGGASPAFEDEEGEELPFSNPFQPMDLEKVEHLLKISEEIPRIEDLSNERIDPEAVNLVPRAIAEQYCLIPIRKEGRSLVVAFSDPADEEAIQEVKYFTSFNSLDVSIKAADSDDIEEAIEKYYKEEY